LCGEIEIKERENGRREGEGGKIFIFKSKFNGYKSSILLTDVILYNIDYSM
jgi:hypothetical protein